MGHPVYFILVAPKNLTQSMLSDISVCNSDISVHAVPYYSTKCTHALSFSLFLLLFFQRFYHQMSQQESKCFYGGQVKLMSFYIRSYASNTIMYCIVYNYVVIYSCYIVHARQLACSRRDSMHIE